MQVLLHCLLVQFPAGDNGRYTLGLQVIIDQNPQALLELFDRNGVAGALERDLLNDFMADVTGPKQGKVLDVATVDVFFVALFELFEDFVIVLNFLLVVVEHFFQNRLALDSETQKGKDLVDDVGFGVLFGVLEDGEIFQASLEFLFFPGLLFAIELIFGIGQVGHGFLGHPFLLIGDELLGWEGELILVGHW
jgi:hypothetical protein